MAESKVNKFRRISLALAESVDAWRIIPRAVIASYSYLVGYMIWFFLSYENIEKVQCDASVLQVLLDHGEALEKAKEIACHVVDVIGPPTTLTALVSTIIGVAGLVFALYSNSGREWKDAQFHPWNEEDDNKSV